ncbi:Ubiquitin-specific protease [Operophtera brumata]|uniref:ubiquitinyl hydrolase 1 n=1 Tax=Operophtera brumata TaxID=104452 RepID=A0A0L7LGW5_OPEBR|nr:Ubiquitin-specific protease [Operophtera brumata]
MEGGDRILVAAGLTAAVVVGAFVLWGPGGAPKVRKRRGQIAGLQNLGRTCFLNTLLQSLAAFVNGTHESARGTPVCPLGVLQSLRAAGWVIPADQQDAHELLHVLLSCVEEETIAMARKPGCLSDALALGGDRAWSALASPASPPSLSMRADSSPPTPGLLSARPASVGRRWFQAAPRARPSPPPPFRGTLASRMQCTVCNTKSPIRYDKFDSISLSMANASTGLTGSFSLAGLLRAFTAPEMLKGVKCEKCCPEPTAGEPMPQGAYTKHIKTLPCVLCVHIGRVEWAGGALSKRCEFVAFPETLPMQPYSQVQSPKVDLTSMGSGPLRRGISHLNAGAGAGAGATYRLAACVVHVGGPRSGHFATYRRGNGFESKRYHHLHILLFYIICLISRCALLF